MLLLFFATGGGVIVPGTLDPVDGINRFHVPPEPDLFLAEDVTVFVVQP